MKRFLQGAQIVGVCLLFTGCNTSENEMTAINSASLIDVGKSESRSLSEAFKTYWYDGSAEITSYKLTQERYGELRDGTAVNIFVTEDFLPGAQVKADSYSEENIPVLKHNSTKKYLTGIYPYAVMTSTFSPLNREDHAIKIAHSMQEWCGQVYIQLNNKKDYEIVSHSYFEGEADQTQSLPKYWLESELWNRIRINPDELPTGDVMILPSFEYFRMSHQKIQTHSANANLVQGDSVSNYSIKYPDLKRQLKIYFSSHFPYTIERWEETHYNGLKTTAEKIRTIQTPYWRQNSNSNIHLRDSLGL